MQASIFSHLAAATIVASLLSSCEPTPRTALDKKKEEASAPSAATATPAPQAAQPVKAAPAQPATPIDSLIHITSTHQYYNIMRPWEKLATSQSAANGIYLGNGLVLTSGDIGTAATYIEMSLPNGSQEATARLVKHDPDRDLTLLALQNDAEAESFFASRHPMEIGDTLKLADMASLWKRIRGDKAQVIDIKVERGAEANYSSPRLIASSSQAMDESGAEGLPIVKDGKLVALVLDYDSDLQSLSLVNAELIKNFLKEENADKLGSPILGLQRSFVKDPVLLRYLKVDENSPGFYITAVSHGGAADQAGLKKGDLIIEVDGKKIDSQGQVNLPLYGALDAFAHLQGVRQQGDVVPVKLVRDGEIIEVPITLNRDLKKNDLYRDAEDGHAPRYLIHGGLLFQPLSTNMLNDLRSKSRGSLPAEFLEVMQREDELIEKGYKELVVLTAVFPTAATLGYNGVGYSFIEKVNGKEVHTLEQLANYLDEPTSNGITSIETNKPPYKIYLDRKLAEESNDKLRRIDIPQLRKL